MESDILLNVNTESEICQGRHSVGGEVPTNSALGYTQYDNLISNAI
jgi:hypothetical protein